VSCEGEEFYMKNPIILMLIVLLMFSFTGCAAIIIGGAAAGAIAVANDTARIEREGRFEKAWDVTYSTLGNMGKITLEDKDSGTIEATVEDSVVKARVLQVTPEKVKIEVRARKDFLPNTDLAVAIANRINEKL
jgi:hypothetical protein